MENTNQLILVVPVTGLISGVYRIFESKHFLKVHSSTHATHEKQHCYTDCNIDLSTSYNILIL